MILNCAVCNQSYETIFPNKKYCSDVCAKRGRINKRKQWEKDTNYNEKQRLDKLVKRQQEKEVRTAEETERLRLKKEEIDHKNAERIKNEKVELELKAKNGDPEARMSLAKPNSKEYWEAYQESEIDYYNKWNTKSISVINEISVFDDDFVAKVLESIEVEGRIYGRLISEKRK
ncbi:hypothetical protein [Carnobacterium sp. FSL W8-0810]|uniref:hypothetical protein n=1 Tax=Carnobacterium sp. FSL W8-0810 TaxID=2954705 RepID=UPI0030F54209